jgi:hypothetical protein
MGQLQMQTPQFKATFEVVLSTTRVYDRVKGREIDAMSIFSTNRSHAWSLLSGLSLAQASAISVIKLPLYDPGLRRFWAFASPMSTTALNDIVCWTSLTIKKLFARPNTTSSIQQELVVVRVERGKTKRGCVSMDLFQGIDLVWEETSKG